MSIVSDVFSIKLIQFSELVHFVTKRNKNDSNTKIFNLSTKTSENMELPLLNRKSLSGELKIPLENLIFPDQCHTGNVKIITHEVINKDLSETDSLVTNKRGICLCILAADCVPVLIFDPDKKVIAAVHAGWRGTINNITGNTVQKMIVEFDCSPHNLIAYIGPSICKNCYEVGSEVVQIFKEKGYSNDIFKKEKLYDKYNLDLRLANKFQLEKHGIFSENIEISGYCTYENNNLFFSARLEGLKTGRFAIGIMLKP